MTKLSVHEILTAKYGECQFCKTGCLLLNHICISCREDFEEVVTHEA